ncbi:MAG: PfkB family carbohydrate kinase [Planctomycetaceae bacterium]
MGLLVAVVGHVEWIRFVRVDGVPPAGGIAHGGDGWEAAGGGGAVAAIQLARLAGESHLFTAFGDDDLGRASRAELEDLGVRVHAATRAEPTRWALTMVDQTGERTIVTVGARPEASSEDPLPWDLLDRADAVLVTAADVATVRRARAARVLVGVSRVHDLLVRAEVPIDAVVGSARDPAERIDPAAFAVRPRLVVRTDGARGGAWEAADGTSGRFDAPGPPGPVVDTYGAGDAFQAGLTYALALGRGAGEAVGFAARCGAAAVTGRGPAGGQLTAEDV